MKKTKLTLIISSLIMVLALVVTIVSVSAAWFSNTTSTKIDRPLEIDSSTVQEFVTIDVDSAMGEGGQAIWPAIAKPGKLLSSNVAPPTGDVLLGTTNDVIQTPAKTAVHYIPLTFVGSADKWDTDGRKTLSLSLDSVSFGKYIQTDAEGKTTITKDFKGEFCVELQIISVTIDPNDTETDPAKKKKIPGEPIVPGTPSNLTGDQIYYNQPNTDGSEGAVALNMLLVPGTEYYVKATIYYNKIDEECNPELLMQYETISFNFTLNVINDQATLDLRVPTTTP